MVELVITVLRDFGIKVPQVFFYTSAKMILAALTSLLISLLFGPWFIGKLYALKIGQVIRKEECPLLGKLHAKKQATPTMGGILILFSMLFSMILWMDITSIFTLILFITTVTLGFLGAIDDFSKLREKNTKGLSGKKKILVQALLSSFIAAYVLFPSVNEGLERVSWFQQPTIKETIKSLQTDTTDTKEAKSHEKKLTLKEFACRLYLPFCKEPLFHLSGFLLPFAFLFIVLVITGSSNAVNLTDGLDGLAAGCLIMVAMCLSIIAFISNHKEIAEYLNILYIEDSGQIAIYLSAFSGACLGFLWYNGQPAEVFMGDTGSLALGGIIGVSAVLLKREFLLAIIGGIFVLEALSVILQVGSYKFRNKKRIFFCAPLHHHFEYKGWQESKIVVRFWIIALLLAIIGMASLKFQ